MRHHRGALPRPGGAPAALNLFACNLLAGWPGGRLVVVCVMLRHSWRRRRCGGVLARLGVCSWLARYTQLPAAAGTALVWSWRRVAAVLSLVPGKLPQRLGRWLHAVALNPAAASRDPHPAATCHDNCRALPASRCRRPTPMRRTTTRRPPSLSRRCTACTVGLWSSRMPAVDLLGV